MSRYGVVGVKPVTPWRQNGKKRKKNVNQC